MKIALYINGIFDATLAEIEEAQKTNTGKTFYLQPHKSTKIKLLAEQTPSIDRPITLYASVTSSLGEVAYRAEIIGWQDKTVLIQEEAELSLLNKRIAIFQRSEKEIYMSVGKGKRCVNLIHIRNLERFETKIPVSCFRKVSNGMPLAKRTRAGGWSPVFEQAEWIGRLPQLVAHDLAAELEEAVKRSRADTAEARKSRLEKAPRAPAPIQVISRGFRRNPDVIVEVLLRAGGRCERCNSPAPFDRASDGTPYLEVHHKMLLADGGEDTVENAIALCPNCHRRAHFGLPEVQGRD